MDLDLPEDEVMGATGVPLCGDPGWERANRLANQPIEYQRDFYPKAPSCSSIPKVAEPASGRKRLVWYAEDVHHFAMSMNPDYRYEGGHWGDVAIHVLYQPGDTTSWVAESRYSGPRRHWHGWMASSGSSPGLRSATCTGSRAAAPSFR